MTGKCTLQAHEDFSRTGRLLSTTQQWNQKSSLGYWGSRTVNFVCTPFTALIDAIAHLALGALSVCGLSQIAWLFNKGAWLLLSDKRIPITFKGGLVNIYQGLRHAGGIFVLPFLSAKSPSDAAELFQHRASQNAAQLRTETTKTKRANYTLIEQLKQNKKNLEDLTRQLTELNLNYKDQLTQADELKGKIRQFAENEDAIKKEHAIAIDDYSSKILKLNEEKNQLTEQNKVQGEEKEALARKNEILTKQIEGLNRQSELLNKQTELLNKQTEQLTKQIELLNQQNIDLLTSREKIIEENKGLHLDSDTPLHLYEFGDTLQPEETSEPQTPKSGLFSRVWSYINWSKSNTPTQATSTEEENFSDDDNYVMPALF